MRSVLQKGQYWKQILIEINADIKVDRWPMENQWIVPLSIDCSANVSLKQGLSKHTGRKLWEWHSFIDGKKEYECSEG